MMTWDSYKIDILSSCLYKKDTLLPEYYPLGVSIFEVGESFPNCEDQARNAEPGTVMW